MGFGGAAMRILVRLLFPVLLLALSGCSTVQAQLSPSVAESQPRRTLRASLYPYIPDAGGAYLAIEEAFERANPSIDLQIHLLSAEYYDHTPGRRSILNDDADVYEIDSVFLADFIEAEKIVPLGPDFEDLAPTLVPFARAIATDKGQLYGMPHWLCGNFLIYRSGDAAIEGVRTLADLERVLHANSAEPRWLIADFSGRSTLGEMYLDAAMDAMRSREVALQAVMHPSLDSRLVQAMARGVALVRPGFGRDSDYHDRLGFYARQFARGEGRAFVGYSEQLFYALSETMLSCRREENCLTTEQVRVAEWPLADAGSSPIAWVDMLVIDADADEQTRSDASRFIRFMAEPTTYRLLLLPQWPNPPRYLLPAREDLYADPELVAAAPLYAQFRRRLANATPVTAEGLNQRLREAGAQLDAVLPPR
jgi:thiamine pyridinylase